MDTEQFSYYYNQDLMGKILHNSIRLGYISNYNKLYQRNDLLAKCINYYLSRNAFFMELYEFYSEHRKIHSFSSQFNWIVKV